MSIEYHEWTPTTGKVPTNRSKLKKLITNVPLVHISAQDFSVCTSRTPAISMTMPYEGYCPHCDKSYDSLNIAHKTNQVSINPSNGPSFNVVTSRTDEFTFEHQNGEKCMRHLPIDPVLSSLKDCPVCKKPLSEVRFEYDEVPKIVIDAGVQWDKESFIQYYFIHSRVVHDFTHTEDALNYAIMSGNRPNDGYSTIGKADPCKMSRRELLNLNSIKDM